MQDPFDGVEIFESGYVAFHFQPGGRVGVNMALAYGLRIGACDLFFFILPAREEFRRGNAVVDERERRLFAFGKTCGDPLRDIGRAVEPDGSLCVRNERAKQEGEYQHPYRERHSCFVCGQFGPARPDSGTGSVRQDRTLQEQ